MINGTSHDQQRVTQNVDAKPSSCRRRIIFPTIHEKWSTLNKNPVFLTGKNLSGPVKIYQKSITLTSSVDSDMPSLTSLSTVSDSTSISLPSMNGDEGRSIHDDSTLDTLPTRKTVRFDPRIWIHEFDRTDADRKALWFSVQDLNQFKFGAMRCIMAYKSRVSNTTTQSNVKSMGKKKSGSVLFSHPALGIDNDYDECEADSHHVDSDLIRLGATRNNIVNQFREAVAENEIRNILVVDPQDICLKLYAKGLRRMFPNATIVTARNKEEALHHAELLSSKKSGNDFDVIVYDEPKSLELSSLNIFEHLNKCIKTPGLNITVVSQRSAIGQSRHIPETDLRWSKPPPSMNDSLRDLLLKTLLMKRGRIDIANKLFS